MTISAEARVRPPIHGGGGNGENGWGGERGGPRRPASPETHRLGMFFALAAIGMLFVALTSSFIVRLGTETRPSSIPMPAILWINTAVLLASSAAIERARQCALRDSGGIQRWVRVTFALGLVFLGGQLAAWRMLSTEGIYLSTNPHSSFFYLLTALHGLHLLGGVAALGYLALRAESAHWQLRTLTHPRARRTIDATALYWHFMDGLWLYMVILLFLWR